MPSFNCTYRNKSGELITDQQSAVDRNALIKHLKNRNCYPISIEDAEESAPQRTIDNFQSNEQLTIYFTRQLSSLLNSGLELDRGFKFDC